MVLTADRNTIRRASDEFFYPCEANTNFFKGQLVVLNAARNAEPATAATGKICVGICMEAISNVGGAAAAQFVKTRVGTFKLGNFGTVTKTSIGSFVYFHDDQSVQASSTSTSIAGIMVDIDPIDSGCWVDLYPAQALQSGGGYLLAANNLSDVVSAQAGLNTLLAGSNLITTTNGIDRVTGGALTLGGATATSIVSTPVLYATGGVDRATAAPLAIGATNATVINIGATATPVIITAAGGVTVPATLAVTGVSTLTGLLQANGGVDRSSAAALAIGATNATVVNIGATATPVAITAAGGITVPGTAAVTGITTLTGVLQANGGIDRATATTLAIGAVNATIVNIGATATPVAIASTGTLTAPGAITGTGGMIGPEPSRVATTGAILVTDYGGTIQASTAATMTAPQTVAANKGATVRLQNVHASGTSGVVFAANTADKIVGSGAFGAAGALASFNKSAGAATMTNTTATSVIGDYIVLQSDGNGAWWIIGGAGIWA